MYGRITSTSGHAAGAAATGTEATSRANQLRRADWLAAGQRLLIERGEAAVRITRLADLLGVTRGSFYWHFKDRADLLAALVDIWSARNTKGIAAALEGAVSLAHGVLSLFEAWIDPARFDPGLDQAMRDWARRSSGIRQAVEQADEARVAAIATLFRRFGFGKSEALVRARNLYFVQVGFHALGTPPALAERLSALEDIYEAITGRPLAPKTAETFRRRHAGSPEEKAD